MICLLNGYAFSSHVSKGIYRTVTGSYVKLRQALGAGVRLTVFDNAKKLIKSSHAAYTEECEDSEFESCC